ncbi:MAG TPA: hypothetical protein VJ750_01440 [Rhizomicrobium sp.]|nr:hypothetical protein [Rhizomicrobium sp.]
MADIPPQPWVHLLEPEWQAWREWQYIVGNNPDPGLELRLRKMGLWPPPGGRRDRQPN